MLFSPDGQTLAVGLDDDTVQVWDVSHRTPIATLDVRTPAEGLILSPAAGTVSLPSKNELVTVDRLEGGLVRWDLRTKKPRSTESAPCLLSPDGSRLLKEQPDGAVSVHAIGTNKPPVKLQLRETEQLLRMHFAADAKALAVWELNGTITTYDLGSGKQLRSVQVKEGLPGVLSPDLRWAAGHDSDPGVVHIRRMTDGAAWLAITEANDYFPVISFSHDGHSLAVGYDRGTVTRWDLASRQQQASASGHGRVVALASSPDGATLAVGHAKKYRWFRWTPICLVDPTTLEEQAVLGERNYRAHMAGLLAGFIVWFASWRCVRRHRRKSSPTQTTVPEPETDEVLLREKVPAAKVGRFWVGRELTLSADELVIATRNKQYTIPTVSIDKLTSEGRWGFRCYRVVHRDDDAPADIRFQSFHPAKWFEAFQQAGIRAEDPVELRTSWALPVKLNAAFEIVETLFWVLLFGGAIVFGLVGALVQGCSG
jgi:hypothetical protein